MELTPTIAPSRDVRAPRRSVLDSIASRTASPGAHHRYHDASLPESDDVRVPRNLGLVVRPRTNIQGDFQRIAGYVRDMAPDIRATVLMDRHYNNFRPGLLARPTMFFSPMATKHLRPLRGSVLHGRMLRKSEEYIALESVGVDVPRWALVTENFQPDLAGFGEYVVSKPDIGGKGAEVKIKRRGRVRWKPPSNKRATSTNQLDMIVQQFIYTGPWPVSYRVTTLFGRVLFAWRVEANRDRRPLSGPDRFKEGGADGGGLSICSSGEGCQFQLCDDPEIIALGERAHAAFPHLPLLGIDIVRDAVSGNLYVIEVNSCGQVWHFSSRAGLGIQSHAKINFESQFDGLRKAARVLIEETRRRAC